ncbi:hypothetical protein ABZ820_22495 [Streptomyces diacarni]|uniref:hypothetical protein n=1 Tax=Streptomyces diacarni TaxID=2800381 RepID=UPI003411BCFF
MSIELPADFPPLDLDKSHLLDADHDAARIADALRHSPHIADAAGEPGDATVRFTSVSGMGFTLTLQDAEPTRDDILPEPVITEAVAAAILNHPDFYIATPDSPREDTITIQTRSGIRYLLALDASPDAEEALQPTSRPADQPTSPAAGATEVADTADRLLAGNPSDSERATAQLLNYMAATWQKQEPPLRQHAQALARTLNR